MSFSLPPQTRNACIPAAVLAVLPDLSAYQEEQGVCDTNIHIPQLADEAIEPSPAANCITGVPQRDGESRSTATPPRKRGWMLYTVLIAGILAGGLYWFGLLKPQPPKSLSPLGDSQVTRFATPPIRSATSNSGPSVHH